MSGIDKVYLKPYKDILVYIVDVTDRFDFGEALRAGNFQAIMNEAETNGLVYTLDEFQEEINNDELCAFSRSWMLIL